MQNAFQLLTFYVRCALSPPDVEYSIVSFRVLCQVAIALVTSV